MSSPIQVTITSRSGRRPEIPVDWYPTDTVYDVLERAGLDPERIYGVTVGPQYIRGFRTEPVWPNSVIEIIAV